MSEAKIQAAIIKNLERDGYFVVKLIQTNKNGIPDLMAIRNGVVSFVEVKAGANKPTDLQLYRHKELTKSGCDIFVTNDQNFTL